VEHFDYGINRNGRAAPDIQEGEGILGSGFVKVREVAAASLQPSKMLGRKTLNH
jgi:hypothetical protein